MTQLHFAVRTQILRHIWILCSEVAYGMQTVCVHAEWSRLGTVS